VAAVVGPARELGEQPRLADAGLAFELQRRRVAVSERSERGFDRAQLGRSPDEVLEGRVRTATLTESVPPGWGGTRYRVTKRR
jgi:hypothetical protein